MKFCHQVLNAVVRSAEPIDADQWIQRLKRGGVRPNEVFYTTLATPFARRGDVDTVEEKRENDTIS